MKLIEKTRAEELQEFITKMNLLKTKEQAINALEDLSTYLHNHDYPNTPHVCAHGYSAGSISLWTKLYLYHEKNVISLLHLMKELHYSPEVVVSEGGINHGYRIDDGIILYLDQIKFPEESLRSMLQIVFQQQQQEGVPA